MLSRRPATTGFFISKFTRAGELDREFAAGNGFFNETTTGSGTALHLLEEGRFLVTGGQRNDLISRCYTANGSLYTPYGENGYARVPVTELVVHDQRRIHWHVAHDSPAPAQDQQGFPGISGTLISLADRSALYLVINAWWGGYEETMAVVVRLDAQGKVDKAFNRTGYFVVTMAGTGVVYNAARLGVLQPSNNPQDSSVVLVVEETLPFGHPPGKVYLLRVSAQGLDFEFGKSSQLQGYVELSDRFEARDLWADHDSLRIVGYWLQDGPYPAAVLGYTADGEIDPGFNDGEPLLTVFQAGANIWMRCRFYGEETGQRMVFMTFLGDGAHVAAVRLLADGRRDASFGDNGFASFPAQVTGWGAFPCLRLAETPTKDVLIGFKEDIYWLLGE